MVEADLGAVLKIIEGFYAAAYGERNWHSAMQDMRLSLGAARACVTRAGPNGLQFVSQETVDDAEFGAPDFLATYLRDPLAVAEWSVPVGQTYGWHEIVDMADLRRRALWHRYYGPMGLHSSLSCRLGDEGTESYMLHVTRADTQERHGSQERRLFDHLVPHLVRAGTMGRALSRNSAALAGFEQLASGILVVDGHCRVHWLNAAAEQGLSSHSSMLNVVQGQVTVGGSRERAQFRALVEGVCRTGTLPAPGGVLRLRSSDPDTALEMVLHVAPYGGTRAFGLPAERLALVNISPVQAMGAGAASDMLASHLGLTQAEARLVLQLMAGRELRDAAARCGITFGTARNYLIRIFRKTGTRRQAALLALAAALTKGGSRA
mgnify:CR=1 FL=1